MQEATLQGTVYACPDTGPGAGGAAGTQDSQQRRWCSSGHCGREFLGERSATHIFRCTGFQPLRNTSLAQCYRRNELEKKRAYDERVREIEHASFSPLVFSTSGGMGTTAAVVYKRLASLIAEKHNKPYSRALQSGSSKRGVGLFSSVLIFHSKVRPPYMLYT